MSKKQKKDDISFGERLWKGIRFAFVFVLIMLLTILLGVAGEQGLDKILAGDVGSSYATAYGETITEEYSQAIAGRYCGYAKNAAQIYNCVDDRVKAFKQQSKMAEEMSLDISEKYLKWAAMQSIEQDVEENRETRPNLMGKPDDEIQDIIADSFEQYWSSSPVAFKKDEFMNSDSGGLGYVFSVLRLNGYAPTHNVKIKERAQKATASLRFIEIKNSELLKKVEKTITVSEAEIKAEFDKKKKARELSEKKAKEKAEKDKEAGKEPKEEPKKKKPLVLDQQERKRLRNLLTSRKKSAAMKKIKEKIGELKKNKKLTLDKVKQLSGLDIITVKEVSLWDLNEAKATDGKTYPIGQNDQVGNWFFKAKLGQVKGPVNIRGNEYYIEFTGRNLKNENVVIDDGPSEDETEADVRGQFAWQFENLPKIQSLMRYMDTQADYKRNFELPESAAQPAVPELNLQQ